MSTRRGFLATAAGFILGWSVPAFAGGQSAAERFAELERESGGRLGVAVLDTETGGTLGYRRDERFPLCSTFKLLAAALVLHRVDEGKEQLERRVTFTEAEVLSYAPVTKQHVHGGMTMGELCDAAITLSDNTAANLLLASFGGPAGLTAFVRGSLQDPVTRLDRTEPTLNTAIPGDVRDTTSPGAIVRDMHRLLLGSTLSESSRQQLMRWLRDAKTGLEKIHAGLPSSWTEGDKTGSGERGTSNDVAILFPPSRRPILAAVYLTDTSISAERENGIHGQIGRLIAERFAGH